MAIEVVPRRTILRLLSESGDGVFLLLRNGKDFLKINVVFDVRHRALVYDQMRVLNINIYIQSKRR